MHADKDARVKAREGKPRPTRSNPPAAERMADFLMAAAAGKGYKSPAERKKAKGAVTPRAPRRPTADPSEEPIYDIMNPGKSATCVGFYDLPEHPGYVEGDFMADVLSGKFDPPGSFERQPIPTIHVHPPSSPREPVQARAVVQKNLVPPRSR
ncbi:MAG: hypothetical protein KVP17_004357 [Porospora cf. gigantea B]|uniref:uncharacterized protein n=1 Tax=Porospora cf. gigantea B TaxID=2853592 RepID=UPI003571DBF3|nr:MAG: hypothetical protein KVP17_004357 [Porospora cf. gigantea B]